jgi:Flp pilus assembly protein TadD
VELQQDDAAGRASLSALMIRWPDDPRLLFLDGSLKAAAEDYAGARAAMRRAVDIAPDYAIARFQLGFLLLTCGEGHAAQEAWGPLHGLPEGHYLRLFVTGLCHLIRDEFDDCERLLQHGMVANDENLPLNHDMQLIIDEARRKQRAGDEGEGAASATQMLLQQAAFKVTKH